MFKTLEKKRWLAILLFILISIQIFWISSLSQKTISIPSQTFPLKSIIYHFCIFFLFAFFLLASLKGKKELTKKMLILVLIISLSYAVLDEIHQYFVPGRYSSMGDIIIDSLGIFISIFIYFKTSKKLSLISEKNDTHKIKNELLSKK